MTITGAVLSDHKHSSWKSLHVLGFNLDFIIRVHVSTHRFLEENRRSRGGIQAHLGAGRMTCQLDLNKIGC